MASKFPSISRISPNVIRILGLNPGPFTLQGTNTYLVGTGPQRLLIDTGEGKPEYLELLDQVLEEEKASLSKIFLTHWHYDHTGGLKSIIDKYPNLPVQVFKKIYSEKDEEYIQYLTGVEFKHGSRSSQPVSVEGATLVPLFTPGHTKDHVGLYFVEEGVLFSGDCILGQGSAVFEDLSSYSDTLNFLLEYQPTIKSIYPAHGPVVPDAIAKIKEYISHRQSREKEIINLLKLTEPPKILVNPHYFEGKPAYTCLDIAKVLYDGYPEQVLKAAQGLIMLHLDKLQKDNLVKEVDISPSPSETISAWQWNL